MKQKKHFALLGLILAAGCGLSASAEDRRLASGEWMLSDGVQVTGTVSPVNNRVFCIKNNETRVRDEFFAGLAKPNNECSAVVVSSSRSRVELDLSCPNQNGEMTGHSTVNISDASFSIESSLALDLGGVPFPIKRSMTARRTNSVCRN